MAYDEGLAQRVRELLSEEDGGRGDLSEKKMFGGLAFMLRGNMCLGIVKDDLMVRLGPEGYAQALREPGARPMDFTGKALKGLVFVGAEGYESDEALGRWVTRGVSFARSLPAK
jgi:TfoX/Sxy family transcriptional regulator of competence genes